MGVPERSGAESAGIKTLRDLAPRGLMTGLSGLLKHSSAISGLLEQHVDSDQTDAES